MASGQRAWRYRLQRDDGSGLVLYAAPTIGAVTTVACAGPAVTGVPRACDALARAVAVPGRRALEPGRGAAFCSRLPATVAQLKAARVAGTRELTAATRAAAQAAAADRLAHAHRAAGAALAPLAGEPVQTAAVGALTATAEAYAARTTSSPARAPAASSSSSFDGTFVLLALLGACAVFLAARAAREGQTLA